MHNRPSTRLARLAPLPLLAMLTLPSCVSLMASDGISVDQAHAAAIAVACGSFQPLRYSSHDTDKTQRQARAHNAAGVAVCGWKP